MQAKKDVGRELADAAGSFLAQFAAQTNSLRGAEARNVNRPPEPTTEKRKMILKVIEKMC